MVRIARMRTGQVAEAKLVLATVAFLIFKETRTLEEYIARIEAGGYLEDVENFKQAYIANGGDFLVAMEGDRVVGTGALRRLDDETGELRRMWLLEQVRGQGVGYRITQRLLTTARKNGYRRIWLQTNSVQEEAVAFYRKVGFHPIPVYRPEDEDELAFELTL
jgi:putative acetyltransferase